MSPDEEAKLYEGTRRLSLWLSGLIDCPWITDDARRSVSAWLGSIPSAWWSRFPQDDARERAKCGSAN